MARLLLVDPFSGAAGDMFLGALVGLGVEPAQLREGLAGLDLDGWSLEVEPVRRAGMAATKARVRLAALGGEEEHPASAERAPSHLHAHGMHPGEIQQRIAGAGLPDPARMLAQRVFELLTRAEARAHGVPPEKVHFHEVGMTDALIDVCGAALGLHLLGVEGVYCRPVATGCGEVTTSHGAMPVPVPATVELMRGLPLAPTGIEAELLTPTGAAILRALDPDFGTPPPHRVTESAMGAGSQDRKGRPNVLRLSLAETLAGEPGTPRTVSEVTFEVDDMSPEELALLSERLPREAVLDMSMVPCFMKKGRPGQRVTVLARQEGLEAVCEAVLRHTSTFGLRIAGRERRVLERRLLDVATPYGTCTVKLGLLHGRPIRVHAEAEAVAALASRAGVPFDAVAAAARAAAWQAVTGASDPLHGA